MDFNDDMIHRTGLPKDVMGLIHDLCYHVPSRGVEGYVKRAQRILSVDGCGSDAPRASFQNTEASPVSQTEEEEKDLEEKETDVNAGDASKAATKPNI